MKILILTHHYSHTLKKHVTEWLPGVLVHTRSDGRMDVRYDDGRVADDCDPSCIKSA